MIFGLLIIGGADFFNQATAYSALQMFAAFGLVALGLGLTMMIGEFDLSVAGVYGLAGCVAVIVGNAVDPWVGLLAAVGVGVTMGLVQGLMIAKLTVGSVPITLGGLLTATGFAFVVTQNRTLSFNNIELALMLNERVGGIFSVRSLVTIGLFIIAAFFVSATRIGRDLIATGSGRRAAIISGAPVDRMIVGVFIVSSVLAALSGALLSYGLASASPTGLAQVLVPAIAATILGGVSLAGGVGTPFGIAAGVLTLTILRAGLNAASAPPFAHELVIGLVLLGVAMADAPYLDRLLLKFRLLGNRR